MLLYAVETVELRMTMWLCLHVPTCPAVLLFPPSAAFCSVASPVASTGPLNCLSRSHHCSLARLAIVHAFTIKVARARSAVAHLHAILEPSS